MSLRPTEPDYHEVSADGTDGEWQHNLRQLHRRGPGQQHRPEDARLDAPGSPVLTHQPAPYNTKARVVDINEFPRHPEAPTKVAKAKVAGDEYRAISRAYAGLD